MLSIRNANETDIAEIENCRSGNWGCNQRNSDDGVNGEANNMAEKGHIHHAIDYIEFSVTEMAKS
jgi:hypothetical protein